MFCKKNFYIKLEKAYDSIIIMTVWIVEISLKYVNSISNTFLKIINISIDKDKKGLKSKKFH